MNIPYGSLCGDLNIPDTYYLYYAPEFFDKLNQIITGNNVSLAYKDKLEAAAYKPALTVDGKEVYKDILEKGAALLEAIICNHVFLDGNKRTGWEGTKCFIKRNISCMSTCQYYEEDAEKLVLDIATKSIKFKDIVSFLDDIFDVNLTGKSKKNVKNRKLIIEPDDVDLR